MKLNIAILFYSATGTNFTLAKEAKKAAEEHKEVDIKILRIKETAPQDAINSKEEWKQNLLDMKDIPEVTLNDLEWADAIIFSFPTRYGNLPSQVQSFFDTTGGLWFEGKLANKVVSGMTSAQNPHGGQETTLTSLYKIMYHWGAIVVPPSYTDQTVFAAGGNPYGLSVKAGKENITEEKIQALKHQVNRTITIASYVVNGLNNN